MNLIRVSNFGHSNSLKNGHLQLTGLDCPSKSSARLIESQGNVTSSDKKIQLCKIDFQMVAELLTGLVKSLSGQYINKN